jgi:Uma2 family endonuclease
MSDRARLVIDPNDPRAPSVEVWNGLDATERERVLAALPNDVPWDLMPPEGDRHRKARESALQALDAFFRRIGRKVYLSSELAVYYPDAPRFVPDLLAVLDVEPHERDKWVVTAEGKGLDLVLEVLVSGSSSKDLDRNVERLAALGIPEYFVYDRSGGRIFGWSLPEGSDRYEPIIPQRGRWPSRILGLDLALDGARLRFFFGTAPLPDADELVDRATSMVDAIVEKKEQAERRAEEEARRAEEEARRAEEEARRAEEEARRAEEEARRAEEEARRAEELARNLAEAMAELERLRGKSR